MEATPFFLGSVESNGFSSILPVWGSVCVMTPVTTSDKSDEVLVKVETFWWSLKPLDINLCRGRWT